jgi:hypothetical protein
MEWEKQEVMRVLAGRPGTIYQESTEQEKEQFRRWIKDVLQTGVTTIEFIKSDGSLRTMKSTLDSVIIPITSHEAVITETAKRKTPENNEVCKVWDTEASAWRSFRYDRIKRISLELG